MSKRTAASADVFDQVQDADGESDAVELTAGTPETEASDNDAETEAGSDTTEGDGETPARRRRFGLDALRRISPTVGALLVLVVFLGGAAANLGWRAYQQHRVDTASSQALQAATDYALILTTMDATKDIDEHYRRAVDGATGEFKDAYSEGATQFKQVLIDNKASGMGIVVSAAVKNATADKVEVLLFVDQSITNAVSPSPRIDRNRIDMTMQRVDGRWLASQVEIL